MLVRKNNVRFPLPFFHRRVQTSRLLFNVDFQMWWRGRDVKMRPLKEPPCGSAPWLGMRLTVPDRDLSLKDGLSGLVGLTGVGLTKDAGPLLIRSDCLIVK